MHRLRSISVACADVVLLRVFAHKSYVDLAPAMIGVRCRIIANRIKMSQIVPDGSKRRFFVSPTFGKIGFATRRGAQALKDRGRYRFKLGFRGTYHVDGDAGGLSQFGNILWRHHAGVVRTVGEHDHNFSSRIASSILEC